MPLTNFQDGISSFGVPVLPGSGGVMAMRNVYFVDANNGSDGNKGLSVDRPFATIQKALNTVKDEDSIFVMRGSYDEQLTTGLSLGPSSTNTAGRGRYCQLIGVRPTAMPYDSPQLYNISGDTASLQIRSYGWRISGFRLVGDTGSPICMAVLMTDGTKDDGGSFSAGTTVDHCVFYGAVGNCVGFDFQGAPPNIRVDNNIFELFPTTGTAMLSSSSATAAAGRCEITNNFFIDNVNGIDMNPRGFMNSVIAYNTFQHGNVNDMLVGFDNTAGNGNMVFLNAFGTDAADEYGDDYYVAGTDDQWIGNATEDVNATNVTGAWTHGDPAT